MNELKLNAATFDNDMDCKTARENYINGTSITIEDSIALRFKIDKCDLERDIQNNPTDNKKIIVYVDNSDGNQRILYGIISIKDAAKIAEYSKVVLGMIAGKIALETPIKGIIVDVAGEYSIDAYLEGAIKSDPLLILYPTSIPGKKLLNDVIKEITNNKPFKKISNEVFDFTKEKIEDTLARPHDFVIPIYKTTYEILEDAIIVKEFVREAGKLVEKSSEILTLGFKPSSFRIINDVIKNPEKLPESVVREIGNVGNNVKKETIKTIRKIWRKRPRFKW